MKKLFIIPLLLLIFLTACKSDDEKFEDGYKAYEYEEYKKALKIWKPLADNGHVDSKYYLAIMYRDGRGVYKDITKAYLMYSDLANRCLESNYENCGYEETQ